MSGVPPNSSRGARQLRKGRASVPGQIYHVVANTFDHRPVFDKLHSGRIIVDSLRHEATRGRALTLTYVVMPDHLHWLLQLVDENNLSRVVHNVKSHSARSLNSSGRKFRAIWQRGFYDRAIRAEEDLPAIARYIVANPLRAGLVKSCGDYPLWDSVWL